MYNIINNIERVGSHVFMEEWGNMIILFCKNKINVFAIEKYHDEATKVWGIKVGLNFKESMRLEAIPKSFKSNLDPYNVDGFNTKDLNSLLLKMYENREVINICLSTLGDESYYTRITDAELDRDDVIHINYENATMSTKGYFNNGVFITFDMSYADHTKLNEMGITDDIIYAFIKIYMITWFQSQPEFN